MGSKNDWSNGKLLAAVEWASGIGGVVAVIAFLVSDGFRKFVHDAWDWCWPWGQIAAAAVAAATLLALLIAQVRRARRAEAQVESTGAESASSLATAQSTAAGAEERADAAQRRATQLEAELAEATADTLPVDRELARDLLAVLPVGSGSIAFARNHSFDNSFDWDSLDGLREFVDVWGGPDKTFHDAGVENARAALFQSGLEFYRHLANKTFHRSDAGGVRIYPDVPLDFELDDGSNRHAIDAFLEANALADQWAAAHDQFVQIARQRLRM